MTSNDMWIENRIDQKTFDEFVSGVHPGPSPTLFRLHLGSGATPGDVWNNRCCIVFLEHFLRDLSPQTRQAIRSQSRRQFKRHVEYLNRLCRLADTAEAAEKAKKERQVKEENRARTARSTVRNAIFHRKTIQPDNRCFFLR